MDQGKIAIPVAWGRRISVKLVFVILLCMQLSLLSGQQSSTLYLLQSVPQTNLLNPAVQPQCKLFVGLPVLNTVHLDYGNSSFTFNELTAEGGLQLNEVYSNLNRMTMISAEAQAYLLAVGYRFNSNYFSFSISDRFNTYTSFSKKLVGLILYGNDPYIGDRVRFTNTRANATYYREYSAGWAFHWDRFTSFGLKGKLLFGKANFYTGASRAILGTDAETFALSLDGNVKVNNSFPVFLWRNEAGSIRNISFPQWRYFSMLMNPRNIGLAADFGVINKYSDDVTISASVLDLGMIFWTDDVNNVHGAVDFLYEGVEDNADFSTAAYFGDLTDSIVNDIIYEVTNRPYISPLPTQVFLAADYHWKENIDIGLVSRNVLVNRRIKTSFTASVNATFLKRVETAVSWSFVNNSALNFGAALAYTGRGLQVYAASDNVVGLFRPLDSRSINVRFGLNLMLGCPVNFNKVRAQEYS
ncbi:MAG: DUF5723 family protein, partial [Bacteroidales bacterium]|nr:DUF5723 family protein [Bacteroidales bacterium]